MGNKKNKKELINKDYVSISWTKENLKNFWNFESQFIDRYFTYHAGEIIVKIFSKYLKDAKSVLDYGAGAGSLVEVLLKADFNVTALEFSENSVNRINKKYKNVENFKGGFIFNDLGKFKKKYDLIFLIEVIEHLNDHDLNEVLDRVNNLITDDGFIIITTPNKERLNEAMICCPECKKVFHRWQHIRSWDEHSLKNFFEKKDFLTKDIFTVDFEYERKKQFFNLRQKIIALLSKKDRDRSLKPNLAAVIKKNVRNIRSSKKK